MRTHPLLAALALATPALTAPLADSVSLVQNMPATKQFSVNQVPSHKKKRTGAGAYAHAIQKYGKTPSQSLQQAAAQQSGSVAANPEQYDQAYLCEVAVGSDSQTLQLDFDTGSSDLWVFSTELPSSEQSGHSIYNPASSSSSSKLNGYTWSISYGDGSGASGDVYTDKVVVGGVTATKQAVEPASSISTEFQQDSNDGLLGLAFSKINTVQPRSQTTFFDTVKSSLDQPVFAVTLKAGQPGTYDFGYIDQSKYQGDITYVSVDSSQGFWGFSGDDVSSNGQSLGSLGSSIADTGTSLILVGDDIVSAYYQGVSGAENDSQQGGYTFPCSTTAPDLTFSIGGGSFTVPGQYINYAPVDQSGETCFGGVQSSGSVGINILGDVFLKNFYVVFDSGNNQLGFADQA